MLPFTTRLVSVLVITAGLGTRTALCQGGSSREHQLTLEHVVTLGTTSAEAAGYVFATNIVTKTPDYYLFVEPLAPTDIHVFDANGAFLKLIGRPGQGPGEFQNIVTLASSDHELIYVLDRVAMRATVLNNDLTFSHSFNLPVLPLKNGGAAIGADLIAVNGYAYADRGAGHRGTQGLVHVIDNEGRIKMSVEGSAGRQAGSGGSLEDRRLITPSKRPGLFWTAAMDAYRIERWNMEGQRVSIISPERSWLDDPYAHLDWVEGERGRPPTWIMDVLEMTPGLLVVLGRVPDERWQEGVDADGSIMSEAGYFDTIIDIFDIASGRLVVRERLDRAPMALVDDDLLLSVDPEGGVAFKIRVERVGVELR